MKKTIFPIIIIIVFLILSGGLFVVNEKEQAVIIQFGKPVGNTITEADWRLFPTLIRFDAVYFSHFKCNKKSWS